MLAPGIYEVHGHPNLSRSQPQTVLIDFELAKNALEAVFPGVKVKRCFFHFSQNIWRKVQANGLQARNLLSLSRLEKLWLLLLSILISPKISTISSIFSLSSRFHRDTMNVLSFPAGEYMLGCVFLLTSRHSGQTDSCPRLS